MPRNVGKIDYFRRSNVARKIVLLLWVGRMMVLIILDTFIVLNQLEFLTCSTWKMPNYWADFGHTTDKAFFSGALSFIMKASRYVELNAASPNISFNKRKPKMSIQCSVRPFKVSGLGKYTVREPVYLWFATSFWIVSSFLEFAENDTVCCSCGKPMWTASFI